MIPGFSELKDTPDSSMIGSASMSARMAIFLFEGPAVPTTSTTRPVPPAACMELSPSSSRDSLRKVWVSISLFESSGLRCRCRRTSMARSTRSLSITCPPLSDEKLAREVRQTFSSRLGHEDCFRDFEPPVFHPHAQNAMNRMVGLQHGAVARSQADCVLSPVGRIANSDGIADTRLLLEPIAPDDLVPGGMNGLSHDTGLHRFEHRLHSFEHGYCRVRHRLARLAQLHGARQAGMVTPAGASEFE